MSQKLMKVNFRYPGPKPNTKETGILMICEAIEAAVRSIKNPDIMKIENMIDKIIKQRIDDGQLSECPLTLDELNKIKGTVDGNTGMLHVLRGIYHIRIEYLMINSLYLFYENINVFIDKEFEKLNEPLCKLIIEKF